MVKRRVHEPARPGKHSEFRYDAPLEAEVESGAELVEAVIAFLSVTTRRLDRLERRLDLLDDERDRRRRRRLRADARRPSGRLH